MQGAEVSFSRVFTRPRTKKSLGRAGSKYRLGKRPVVRGVAINPVDHPHEGGEGKAPIGRKKNPQPLGVILGLEQELGKEKNNDSFILHRRK